MLPRPFCRIPTFHAGDPIISNGNTVSVTVKNGPTTTVPWTQGMTALQALEGAWTALNTGPVQFNYAVQYYGSMGYFLVMMNNTADSAYADPPVWPACFWAYLLNGTAQFVGLD